MNLINIAYAVGEGNATTAEAVEHVAETSTHAAQASEGVLASLGINGTLFVFQLINFIVVALILWFLVLKPLVSKMAERQEKIEKSLFDAAEVEQNLRKSETKYQEKIDEAKAEAAKIMTKAQVEAKTMGEKMKNKSKQEIELLINQAKKNINIEKEEMISEVKKQAGELVVTALEKVLEEKIDNRKDKELILRSLKNIKV